MDGSGFRPIPNLDPQYATIGWTPDGSSVYVSSNRFRDRAVKVYRVNVSTGKMDYWKSFGDSLPPGSHAAPPHFSADGSAYAYVYEQVLSEAYVVKGLK